jgi:hypothetical protein
LKSKRPTSRPAELDSFDWGVTGVPRSRARRLPCCAAYLARACKPPLPTSSARTPTGIDRECAARCQDARACTARNELSEQSPIERIKELDKERAALFEQAKEEALTRATSAGADPGHQEQRSPSTKVPTEANGWRSMVLRSIARLVPQPGQKTSSQGVPASSAALIVGDHSMSRPRDS